MSLLGSIVEFFGDLDVVLLGVNMIVNMITERVCAHFGMYCNCTEPICTTSIDVQLYQNRLFAINYLKLYL